MKRRFVRGLLAVLCLTLLCGCVDTENLFKPLSSKKEILAALSERYGEEFIIITSEKIEGEDVIRGKAWLAAPKNNPELRFVVEEYVKRAYSTGPVPYIGFSYKWREYYADTVLYQMLFPFLEENGIRHENLGDAPVHDYILLAEDTDREYPSILFSEEELESKLPLLAEFVEGLNEIYPCNNEVDGPSWYQFWIRCETAERIEARELINLKPYASSRFELDVEKLAAGFHEEIDTERVINRFIADFTAYCEKEGLVWYLPDRKDSWGDYLYLYFSSVEQVKTAEPKLAAFVEEYKDQEPYLSPLCENMNLLTVHLKQVGTDKNLAFWSPFDSGREKPPYLCLDFNYARGVSES